MTKYLYFQTEQSPLVGDIINEVDKDSYCIVTHVGSFNFERVRIGPNAKVFKPIQSTWQKHVSSFEFIDRQDDVEWYFATIKMIGDDVILGDIFRFEVTPNQPYQYIMVVKKDDENIITVTIDTDEPKEETYHPYDFPIPAMLFIGNQEAMMPTTTKSALEWLFKDGHFPEPFDIYTDKYGAIYQVVEIEDNKVVLASMSESPYANKEEWPLFLWKDKIAYDFFDKGKFICSDKDVEHAPNIGDIYTWTKNLTNPEDSDQYAIVTDISNMYMAPTLLFIDDIFPADLIQSNSEYKGSIFESLEEFINLETDGKKWKFLMSQENIIVDDSIFTTKDLVKPELKYQLPPIKQEQIKLGTLLAYVPEAGIYFDCVVVTTGEQGFSVWWLKFEGGDPELQEGFKQTFKYDKHLPLFLYNGHQDDTAYDNLLAVKPLYEDSINNPVETPLMVPISGKVEGLISHIPDLMEGVILNYYPYKDMKLPKKQATSFWTLLVIEIGGGDNHGQFKVMVLDRGTAPHPPSTKEHYWFNLDTYLKGDQGTLKYVMHMNDNAVMTDDEIEIAADDILTNYGVHIK